MTSYLGGAINTKKYNAVISQDILDLFKSKFVKLDKFDEMIVNFNELINLLIVSPTRPQK